MRVQTQFLKPTCNIFLHLMILDETKSNENNFFTFLLLLIVIFYLKNNICLLIFRRFRHDHSFGKISNEISTANNSEYLNKILLKIIITMSPNSNLIIIIIKNKPKIAIFAKWL